MRTTKKVKDLPKIDRPREKLIKYGASKLKDEELLAILLGSGTKNLNVISLSKQILKKHKKNFDNLKIKELKKIKGLGDAKCTKIIASIELGKRLLTGKKTKLLITPKDIFNDLKDIRKSKKEHFVVFYLDARNQEIKKEIISIGTVNTTLVHPREVFEPAVKNVASQVIIAHNHPSSNTTPSTEDKKITEKLVEAGKILGIELSDHIIVTDKDYFSFRENGLLK